MPATSPAHKIALLRDGQHSYQKLPEGEAEEILAHVRAVRDAATYEAAGKPKQRR